MFLVEIRSIFRQIMNDLKFHKNSLINPFTTFRFFQTDIFSEKRIHISNAYISRNKRIYTLVLIFWERKTSVPKNTLILGTHISLDTIAVVSGEGIKCCNISLKQYTTCVYWSGLGPKSSTGKIDDLYVVLLVIYCWKVVNLWYKCVNFNNFLCAIFWAHTVLIPLIYILQKSQAKATNNLWIKLNCHKIFIL